MDNCSYGADEINQTFSKLTTEGVSLFNYTNSDNPLVALNNAVKGFVSPGIEMYNTNACKVIYDKDNGTFTISPGNSFMFDGSTITIDSEAFDITQKVLELRKTNDSDIWVCFYRDVPKNSIDILVNADKTFFDSEYSVPLARISSENSVVDLRRFAKTKLAPCSKNVINEVTINLGVLSYKDTGYKLRRTFIENVFPGASKVFLNGVVRDIQKVDIEAGENLVYERAFPQGSSSGISIAFNMTAEGLEVWASQSYNSTTPGDWDILIF